MLNKRGKNTHTRTHTPPPPHLVVDAVREAVRHEPQDLSALLVPRPDDLDQPLLLPSSKPKLRHRDLHTQALTKTKQKTGGSGTDHARGAPYDHLLVPGACGPTYIYVGQPNIFVPLYAATVQNSGKMSRVARRPRLIPEITRGSGFLSVGHQNMLI